MVKQFSKLVLTCCFIAVLFAVVNVADSYPNPIDYNLERFDADRLRVIEDSAVESYPIEPYALSVAPTINDENVEFIQVGGLPLYQRRKRCWRCVYYGYKIGHAVGSWIRD